MTLTRVVLRLARNPGYPDGDDRYGYLITAPLDTQGHLVAEDWPENREACEVVRFAPGVERDADGRLTHRGGNWFIHYDEVREGDDEPLYRLGEHRLAIGDYVTIHESTGKDMTYRVTEHQAVK
ncbi:MAG: hypothetical protein R3C52_03440 [Hyphomonadaceae bacterium]